MDGSACAAPGITRDRGAVGLATILVMTAMLIAMALIMVAVVDVVATKQRGQHVADMIAVAAMQHSPLTGGSGEVDREALGTIAKGQKTSLLAVDTTGWPLTVRITIRAQPYGLLNGILTGAAFTSTAEVVPAQSTNPDAHPSRAPTG